MYLFMAYRVLQDLKPSPPVSVTTTRASFVQVKRAHGPSVTPRSVLLTSKVILIVKIWFQVSFVGCFIETDISYWGSDILSRGSIENQDECAELCASTDGGLFWTYIVGDKQCYVKGSAEGRTSLAGRISGNVACGGATFI